MSSPKILLLDIETQPDLVYTWGVYEQNAISVKEHWQLLSFSAKWLGGKHITRGLPDYKGYKPGGSDEKLLADLWDLLDEADIVVAHNGVDFDIKKINARFIALGFIPPSPYKVVDTKRAVKQVAAFSSNRLNWLCKQLDIGAKTEEHQDFQMWLDCMAGNKKAWAKMLKYNHHDVELLEELYKLVSPWIKQPNMGVWADGLVCPNPGCGGANLERRGLARNKTRVYQRFQCKSCGAWCRAVKSELEKASVVAV